MSQDLVVDDRLLIPAAELCWRFSRASGPGGQHVNSTDSRVELLLDLERCTALGPFRRARLRQRLSAHLVNGSLRVVVAEERSQWQNRQKALRRLAELLREGLKPDPPSRRQTRPTHASKKRRLNAKKRRGDLKRNRSYRAGSED